MITVSLKKVDGSITKTYDRIEIKDEMITLSTSQNNTIDEVTFEFVKGVLSAIKVKHEQSGVYAGNSPKVVTYNALYAALAGKGAVIGVTTFATMESLLSGITEHAEIIKSVKAANVKNLVKSEKSYMPTQEDIKRGVEAALARRNGNNTTPTQQTIDKAAIMEKLNKARMGDFKSGDELAAIIKSKEIELIKCGDLMAGNAEWVELADMVKGQNFSNDAFLLFSDVLGEKNYNACLTKIRQLSQKLKIISGNVVIK